MKYYLLGVFDIVVVARQCHRCRIRCSISDFGAKYARCDSGTFYPCDRVTRSFVLFQQKYDSVSN